MTPPTIPEFDHRSPAHGAGVEPWRARSWLPSVASGLVLVALYVVVLRYVVGHDAYRAVVSRTLLSSSPWINYLVFCLLVNVALLAPGSTALLVLAAVPVFGPSTTYVLALASGISATVVAHQLGWWLRALEARRGRWERIRALEHVLVGRSRRLWLLSFASRAIPNPLYDVWAYAFGFFRVPLRTYLLPACLGGALALFFLCYGPRLLVELR